MLDSFIIDRIRRERERERERERGQIPLRIERPPPMSPPAEERPDPEQPRGSVIIDFQL
jgi:hypothetical protein